MKGVDVAASLIPSQSRQEDLLCFLGHQVLPVLKTFASYNNEPGYPLALLRLEDQQLDLQVHVFVPAHISTVKARAIEQLGAVVEKIAGGYDECVEASLRFSRETFRLSWSNWHVFLL